MSSKMPTEAFKKSTACGCMLALPKLAPYRDCKSYFHQPRAGRRHDTSVLAIIKLRQHNTIKHTKPRIPKARLTTTRLRSVHGPNPDYTEHHCHAPSIYHSHNTVLRSLQNQSCLHYRNPRLLAQITSPSWRRSLDF